MTPDTPEGGLGGVAGTGAMSDTVDPQLPEVVDEVVDDEEDMFEQR